MKTRTKTAVVLAIIIFAGGFFVVQRFFPSQRNAFESLVAKPIPKSVHIFDEGHSFTMDSTFRVLRFQISKTDFQSILDSQHYVPIDENEEFKAWDKNSNDYIKIRKEDYLVYWKRRIQQMTKLNVDFPKTCQILVLKEGNGRKYLFFDTNGTEVVFVAAAN